MAKRYAASSRQHMPATAVVMAAKPVPGSVSRSHSSTDLPPPAAPPPLPVPPGPPPAAAAAAAAPPGASRVRVASSFSSVAYSCVSSRSSRSLMISSLADAESSVLLGPAGQPSGRTREGVEGGGGTQRCTASAVHVRYRQARPCGGLPNRHVHHVHHAQHTQHPLSTVAGQCGRSPVGACRRSHAAVRRVCMWGTRAARAGTTQGCRWRSAAGEGGVRGRRGVSGPWAAREPAPSVDGRPPLSALRGTGAWGGKGRQREAPGSDHRAGQRVNTLPSLQPLPASASACLRSS